MEIHAHRQLPVLFAIHSAGRFVFDRGRMYNVEGVSVWVSCILLTAPESGAAGRLSGGRFVFDRGRRGLRNGDLGIADFMPCFRLGLKRFGFLWWRVFFSGGDGRMLRGRLSSGDVVVLCRALDRAAWSRIAASVHSGLGQFYERASADYAPVRQIVSGELKLVDSQLTGNSKDKVMVGDKSRNVRSRLAVGNRDVYLHLLVQFQVGPARNIPKTEGGENNSSVLYIGRISHGFYANEMAMDVYKSMLGNSLQLTFPDRFTYPFVVRSRGGPTPHRPAEDMAFAVGRFVQNNGSYFNYYMSFQSLLSPFLN